MDSSDIGIGTIFLCMIIVLGILCCMFADVQTNDSIICDAQEEYFLSISENMTNEEKHYIAYKICNDIGTDPAQIDRYIVYKIFPPDNMFDSNYCVNRLLDMN